jgi:hypothetical protein
MDEATRRLTRAILRRRDQTNERGLASPNQFDLARSPGLVEERFERAVEA